jgi:hypothetical protein
MDLTGLHFPDPKQPRNSIEKLKRQWEATVTAREKREKKLKLMEELPICCTRLCTCDHVIPGMFLREMRRKFLQCDNQASITNAFVKRTVTQKIKLPISFSMELLGR